MSSPRFFQDKPPFNYRIGSSALVVELHTHPKYELFYLLRGQRRYFINGATYDLRPGDLVLIPPYVAHQVLPVPYTDPREQFERYLLFPQQAHFSPELRPCFERHYYHLAGEDSTAIRRELELIGQEMERDDEYTYPMYLTCLERILIRLARHYPQAEQAPPPSDAHIDQIVEDVVLYIQRNAHRDLTLPDTAHLFKVSPGYLSTAFREIMGIGYNAYVNKTRLARSLKLLSSTDLSVAQIAAQCGFHNSNYFATVFKKAMGVSPTAYRKPSSHDTIEE